ncbi:conserved hypothetical protein [Gammaproteobacteria bacterium]
MSEHLLILGAGVDRTSGIDFPLANTLLPDVTRYLDGPGKSVDAALRDMLPNLRFNFGTMVARAVDKIATREPSEQREMIERVQKAIKDLPPEKEGIKKHGSLIIKLFNKLAIIAEHSQIDDEMYNLIKEVFGDAADDMLDSDSILDIHKLSLSDTFKAVLKYTLRMGLSSDRHEVAEALGAEMLNIETLLIDKFLGFYNNKASEIKNYIYISWALWAFLVDRQREVMTRHNGRLFPFYSNIPRSGRAITLNYTSFLNHRLAIEDTVHFHGGLAEYVRMDNRDLIPIDDIAVCDPAAFIKDQVSPNVDLTNNDPAQQRHVIPALVPPLRLKPILSHRYINLWSKASQWVEGSRKIVVIGYSFNSADEHFNDILRVHSGKKVDIITPGATTKAFVGRMEKVFGVAESQYSHCKVQEHESLKARGIRLIAARADQIDLNSLFKD